MKPIYAVSASVGSGKTVAAVEYIARREASTQDFIYVAPTIKLLNQTERQLRSVLSGQDAIRSVHLIHSEAAIEDCSSAAKEALLAINERPSGIGRVVFLTTTTFLRILPSIDDLALWNLILDEAFAPVTFINYHLGPRPEEGLGYFRELFFVDQEDNYRVSPVGGRGGLVEEIASGQLDHCGQRYLGQRQLAQAVSNSAIRCELVVTQVSPWATTQVQGCAADPMAAMAGSRALLFACYVTPEYFGRFREVIILSALFEHTVLYHLWTRCFGVSFIAHPWFGDGRLRDVHTEQGPTISVGHLLHPTDRASKHNLFANRHTGKPGENSQGERVLDYLVRLGAEFFQGSRFLLQTNNRTGYGAGASMLPGGAVAVPVVSHGLNEYMDADNIVALAVTNPNPQETEWVQSRTGLTKDEVLQAYRIHTVYQAVGRTSIRSARRARTRKIFLVAGYDDARLLHQLFRGSTWLGQVGDQAPLKAVREAFNEPGEMKKLAGAIAAFLDSLPPDVTAISSRSVKAAVAPEVAPRTWTEAARIAAMDSAIWRKDGHQFRRLVYSDFFEERADEEQCAETGMINQ